MWLSEWTLYFTTLIFGAEYECVCIHMPCLIALRVINKFHIKTDLVPLLFKFNTYRVGISIIVDCHIISRPIQSMYLPQIRNRASSQFTAQMWTDCVTLCERTASDNESAYWELIPGFQMSCERPREGTRCNKVCCDSLPWPYDVQQRRWGHEQDDPEHLARSPSWRTGGGAHSIIIMMMFSVPWPFLMTSITTTTTNSFGYFLSFFTSFLSSLFLPSAPVIWWFFGLRWRRHVGDSSSDHSSCSSSRFSPRPLQQHWHFHHHCHHRHHHRHNYNALPCTSPIQPVSEDQLTMKVAAVTDGPWDSRRGAFAIRCCGYVRCGRAQRRERDESRRHERDGDRKHIQVEGMVMSICRRRQRGSSSDQRVAEGVRKVV